MQIWGIQQCNNVHINLPINREIGGKWFKIIQTSVSLFHVHTHAHTHAHAHDFDLKILLTQDQKTFKVRYCTVCATQYFCRITKFPKQKQ